MSAPDPSGDRPLHIGFYSPELPDSGASNGIVTYTRVMRDALRALGHRVTIVSAREIEHADGHIEALPAPGPIKGRLLMRREARHGDDGSDPWSRMLVMRAFEAARRAGVDVFEMEESFGWAGRLTGRGVPIVARLHGPHCFVRDTIESSEQQRRGDLREAAEFASLGRVSAVTAPTERLLGEMAPRAAMPAIMRAIPNPIALAPIAEMWRSGDADPDQLLFVGRFDQCKGADIALRAFARAIERNSALKLVFAGPDRGLACGNGEVLRFDRFAQSQLSSTARDRIRFLGEQSPESLMPLRQRSSLAIVASRFENFPYSIAESMAAGQPVLASDTFGSSALVRNGIDGRIVPVGDIEATAEAIVTMTSNRSELERMGRSARERVEQWLAPDRIARETISVYREAVAQTG